MPGLPLNPWGGPPTSGNSTPLRENIPESPTDGFPDFGHLPTPESITQPRRARAGTVPSRFPPGLAAGHLPAPGYGPNSARNTPSQSPYNNSPSPGLEATESQPQTQSSLLSRLRAGSMPQRSQFSSNLPGSSSPFGPSIFSSWNPTHVGRERGSTLASIASVPSNGPSSPSQSQFSREGGNESDIHMRTLDYLGLAETPQPSYATMGAKAYVPSMAFHNKANRIRSYSVNNKEIHADEYPEDGYETDGVQAEQGFAALQQSIAATQEAIRAHNASVQAFVDHTNSSRRRAATAGVLDNPSNQLLHSYFANNIPQPNPSATERNLDEQHDLTHSMANMGLRRSNSRSAGLLAVDEQVMEGPTNALWLGNIPTSTTTSTLEEMFKSHGAIKSVRVLTHKNCGFVNFFKTESAISAKASMNGKEIFPGASPIRINFAKPPSEATTPGHDGAYMSPSPDPFGSTNQETTQTASTLGGAVGNSLNNVASASASQTVPRLGDIVGDIMGIVAQFGANDQERELISQSLQCAVTFSDYSDEIPPIREPSHARTYDAPKLRELRKRIDNGSLPESEIEDAAMNMLPEVAELASDYLGNTVVQKLFDHCSEEMRDAMLNEIAPHLAEIGCHKNGTWAAQKIIDVCRATHQMDNIVQHIHPYTVPLFLDQFGNYVVQGCLKFEAPHTNFIFETMMAKMSQLSQARFGARAMRACLESHHASKDQQRMLAAQIAVHSVHLSTDQNGALLLTWYLDTCTLPNRRIVLAPRLVPHLVHLCTHKVAYLTVLKVINQKVEPDARDTVLNALFFSPDNQVLESILRDSNYGATLIFKVVTMPFFDENIRTQVVENVKNVLIKIKALASQGYKRLMDEVGLSIRNGGPSSRDSSTHPDQRRPGSRHANGNGSQAPQGNNRQMYGQQQQAGFDMADPTMGNYPPYGMYNGNGSMTPPMAMQQMAYQQPMMGRAGPPMNYGYGVPGAYGAYGNNMPPNASPVPTPATMQPMPGHGGGYGPPGFPTPHQNYGGFNSNMGGGMPPNMNYGQQGGRGNRRNHVSRWNAPNLRISY